MQHPAAFRHEVMLYDSPESFVEGAAPFIRDAVTAGEPIMVAIGAEKIELLRTWLGEDADWVVFADMAELGANPARIIPAWQDFVDENAASGRPMRGIGEPIWADRSPTELVECQCHEALLNVAFADASDFHLICPYDTAQLDGAVIAEAEASHPFVGRRARARPTAATTRCRSSPRRCPTRRRTQASTRSPATRSPTCATSRRRRASARGCQHSGRTTSCSPSTRSPPTASATAAAAASCASGAKPTP